MQFSMYNTKLFYQYSKINNYLKLKCEFKKENLLIILQILWISTEAFQLKFRVRFVLF